MGAERRMNFYESFYGLTSLLPERERQKVNTALLDYFFESKEPEGLSDQGSKVFEGCRGRINASVRGRENVEKRYSNDSTCPSKPPSTYSSKGDSTYPSKAPSTYGTDRERDIDIEREKKNAGAHRKKFSPPSVEEITEYLTSAGLDSVDPERFFDYYGQQGWKLSNGNPMKDWKAAARNWHRRNKPKGASKNLGAFDEYLS